MGRRRRSRPTRRSPPANREGSGTVAEGSVETEAELQARLESQIRAALPLLPARVKLERHLRLKLGHHSVVVDGLADARGEVRGRYDVLVFVDDEPLLLAELKAPHLEIGEADLGQALSYARTHEPIVPLTLVTNGATTLLVRTYDGAKVPPGEVAAERLEATLSAATRVAASEAEEAIRTLLGTSTGTWVELFAAWNIVCIREMSGSVRDFGGPLADGFAIPREAVEQIEHHLSAGARVVVVHAPPLAGVTNVLAQFAGRCTGCPALLLDAGDHGDVLQFIANRLSRELSFPVTKDEVRGWINTRRGLVDLVFAIDGLPDGLDELLEFAEAGLLRLVLGMNSEAYRRECIVAGRGRPSRLGRASTEIELLPLSDNEFLAAAELIDERFEARFFHGAHHATELRWPRTLRIITAALPRPAAASRGVGDHESRLMLPPILGPSALEACSRAFASDPKLSFDLRRLAQAFLDEVRAHANEPDWLVATWGRPSVPARQQGYRN